ncbi:hypothetical protein ACFFSY_17255 [Paenibacillus aurantiacus]|uniref:Uncharacterized protein n=1 Tax=Paenibacillus aurantiacus TaxID=1936118 RepID=A0ABV5KTX3_9BACL
MTSTFNPKPAKLSQWDALSLESLRQYGWTDDELIRRVLADSLPNDESKFRFDYAQLVNLAREQGELFSQAVKLGYQVKYSTLRGIESWLLLALNREAELHADPGREAVTVSLTEAEAARLASILSFGWSIAPQDETPEGGGSALYRVAPIERGPVIE